MTKRVLVALVVAATVLQACGKSSPLDQAQTPAAEPRTTAPDRAPRRATPAPRDPLRLPAGVPVTASRVADPAQANVIRAWAAALRSGDIAAANALWAAPAKVQNGTPVLVLSSRAAIGLFNGSLPCGSVVTSAGGAAGGFTIATVRLTRRRGARCDAAGATARTAIRVRGGKIVEWYRLPDDPDAPDQPAPPPGDVDATTV